MGNTPSNQASPSRGGSAASASNDRSQMSPSGGAPSSSRNPNLRLPMPQRPTHISPVSSNPTSPNGGRGSSSPRRRKSLELPDLNKLSFTPAAPVVTLATHTSHHLATPSGHNKRNSTGGSTPTQSPQQPPGRSAWRQALGGRIASPLAGSNALGAMSRIDGSASAPRTAPVGMPNASVSPTRAADGSVNPYFPNDPPETSPTRSKASPARPVNIPGRMGLGSPVRKTDSTANTGTEPPPTSIAPTPPSRVSREKLEEDDGLVSVPIQWNGGGRTVAVTGNFADNWKGRIKLKKS